MISRKNRYQTEKNANIPFNTVLIRFRFDQTANPKWLTARPDARPKNGLNFLSDQIFGLSQTAICPGKGALEQKGILTNDSRTPLNLNFLVYTVK